MTLERFETPITIATLLLLLFMGGWVGYNMGKNSPCTQVENVEIKPVR